MIKFIAKIFKFIFILFVLFILFAYIPLLRNNISFKDSIAYLTTVTNHFFNIDNSENISINNNISNSQIITSTNSYYYYDQLDNNGKIIYSALENNIDNLKTDNYILDFSTTFNDLLNTTTGQFRLKKSFQSALNAFFYDHPELFYIDSSKISLNIICISFGFKKTYTVDISPKDNNYLHNSFNSKQEVEIAIKQLEKIKNNIVNTVSGYNTYNKIKYVHDFLVSSIEYDNTLSKPNTHNIYGALIEKQVVCEGYAKAFKYIMDCLDIECILVSGNVKYINDYANEDTSHMWNYVKLNDSWYGVDVTWDDPIGNHSINIRRDFLLKGYYTFNDLHTPNGKITDNSMLFKLPILSYNNFR